MTFWNSTILIILGWYAKEHTSDATQIATGYEGSSQRRREQDKGRTVLSQVC